MRQFSLALALVLAAPSSALACGMYIPASQHVDLAQALDDVDAADTATALAHLPDGVSPATTTPATTNPPAAPVDATAVAVDSTPAPVDVAPPKAEPKGVFARLFRPRRDTMAVAELD